MLRTIIVVAVFLVALLNSGRPAAIAEDQPARPNIVLIVADDLGWADLGCYGSRFHRTPYLDELAQDGLRFTHGYAACPVCSPSRAALMTGRYPARLHLTDWLPGRPDRPDQRLNRPQLRQELELSEITIAELLHEAGYVAASMGKWHLGGAGFGPRQQGFDINIAGDAAGTPYSYIAPYQRGKQTIPGLEDAPEGEYLTDRLTTEAEKFIEANRDRPFFLYLPHFAVHTPMVAPESRIKQFTGDQASVGKQNNTIYAAMLQGVDDSVGRIVRKLNSLDLTEKTLVIFTSDNGGLATVEGPHTPATNNAPLREGKGWLYEGGIRVPFLMKWPGVIPAGKTSDTPVVGYDLLPTIADVCGLKLPQPVDGVSLTPIWKSSGHLADRDLFWHYPHYANQGSRPGGVIRRGDWKLIEFYEQGRRELYNVRQDVGEGRNQAADHPELVAELGTALENWRQHVAAQRNTPNPDFVPNPPDKSGKILLHSKTADVHGEQLRYEPLPHKNTLGFWIRAEDWASWEFTTTQPGKFKVVMLQGCGNGSGGSEVELAVGDQKLNFTVQETGGFQAFVSRELGEVTITEPGRHVLSLKPLKKPGVAVMDVRQIELIPVEGQ